MFEFIGRFTFVCIHTMYLYMYVYMHSNTNTAIDMDVDVEMAIMTMDYQMLFFWEYFDNSFDENLVIRTLSRDLLTGLDLPRSVFFNFAGFPNAGMRYCPASSQSGTSMKKTNVAGTGPVPD